MLTDTHIHLYAEEFKNDLDSLMMAAFKKEISRFFIPNIECSTMESMIEICSRYAGCCFPMMGLHPCSVKENYRSELFRIEEMSRREKMVAIGETGIDLYWDKTLYKEQREAFIIQMHWASERNLPLVIHSRESTQEIISILRAHDNLKLRGIFHCFSGSLQQAKDIIEMGFLLGIGGVLTFKNSGLDKIIMEVDMQHIVLETDAPYLAPVPFRGKRNEPGYLALVAEKLASIKNLSVDEIAKITTANATAVFGI